MENLNQPVTKPVKTKEVDGKKFKLISREELRLIKAERKKENKGQGLFNAMSLALFILVFVMASKGHCQVRIQAGAGVVLAEKGPKINGILNVGYEVGNFSPLLDLRSAINQKKAFFGLNAGYNIQVEEDVYFRPYAGYWLRHTGSTVKQDRYIENGIVKVLSTARDEDLNGHDWGAGAQYFNHAFFLDAGYVGQWQVSAGVTFKF